MKASHSPSSTVPPHAMLMPDVPSSDLTLEEIGVLSQMLNLPECDYITPARLATYAADSPRVVTTILNSLVSKEYLHRMGNVYCVNKYKVTEMHLHQIPQERVIRFTDETAGEEV